MDEVALVLVDLWNLGWGPAPLAPELGWEAEYERGRSNIERMRRITLERIVPALEAARRAGLTVAHLNLPEIAARYPRWRHRTPDPRGGRDTGAAPVPGPTPGQPERAWPPEEFTAAWRAEHRRLVFDERWMSELSARATARMDIPAPARLAGADAVVTNGEELHDLFARRRLRVACYAGFDTNSCVLNKGGGIRDMARRGYRCVLLRDATTSKEVAETVAGEWVTRVTVSLLERDPDSGGFTALTDDFIAACRNAV